MARRRPARRRLREIRLPGAQFEAYDIGRGERPRRGVRLVITDASRLGPPKPPCIFSWRRGGCTATDYNSSRVTDATSSIRWGTSAVRRGILRGAPARAIAAGRNRTCADSRSRGRPYLCSISREIGPERRPVNRVLCCNAWRRHRAAVIVLEPRYPRPRAAYPGSAGSLISPYTALLRVGLPGRPVAEPPAALTPPFRPYRSASRPRYVSVALSLRSPPLGITQHLPYGARTFLDALAPRPPSLLP